MEVIVDFSLPPDEAPLVGSLQPASTLELQVVHLLHHGVVTPLVEILHNFSSPRDVADLLDGNFEAESGQHSVFCLDPGKVEHKLTNSRVAAVFIDLESGTK